MKKEFHLTEDQKKRTIILNDVIYDIQEDDIEAFDMAWESVNPASVNDPLNNKKYLYVTRPLVFKTQEALQRFKLANKKGIRHE